MIEGLKPYPEYKESGVPWLGRVPGHWEVRRIKTLLREVDRRTSTGSEPLLSLRMHAGLVDHQAMGGKFIPPSALIGYKRILPGEIVMNRMRAAMGLFAAATSEGLVSPDYAIFRPIQTVENSYLVQLFRLPMMAAVFRLESRGLGTGESGFLRLYSDRFGMLGVPLPPLHEQSAIVRFLDHATRRIDAYIRAKRKLIALLNEQKQVVIHRAVTRGLDPNVKTKDSGVPWLGEVPEHWEVVPLKRLADFKSGAGFPVSEQGNAGLEIPFIKVSDMNRAGNERFMARAANTVSEETARRLGAHIFPASSIIFPKVGGAMLTNKRRILLRPSCVDNNIMACVLHRGTLEYVFLILEQLDLGRLSKPGPVPAIGEGEVREIRVALPPPEEQQALVAYVQEETRDLSAAITRTEQEITLLREYRTRLIADVVTGQLDVREAAKNLPDELPDDAPDLDDATDADPLDEEAPDSE